MELETFSGVPIPRKSHGKAGRKTRVYPFATMGVGEIFFIENRERNNIMSYASHQGKALDREFTTRLLWAVKNKKSAWEPCPEGTKGSVKGIMVWRTK
jgi:hypothetical protein